MTESVNGPNLADLDPSSYGPVLLCTACARAGRCRLGLRVEELAADGEVRTELVCDESHEGGPQVAHGGWTAGVLDELVGHVPLLHGQLAVTGTLTVKFVRPVPVGHDLVATARKTREEGSRWFVRADLRLASSGALLASGEAILVLRDPEHFDRHQVWLAGQA